MEYATRDNSLSDDYIGFQLAVEGYEKVQKYIDLNKNLGTSDKTLLQHYGNSKIQGGWLNTIFSKQDNIVDKAKNITLQSSLWTLESEKAIYQRALEEYINNSKYDKLNATRAEERFISVLESLILNAHNTRVRSLLENDRDIIRKIASDKLALAKYSGDNTGILSLQERMFGAYGSMTPSEIKEASYELNEQINIVSERLRVTTDYAKSIDDTSHTKKSKARLEELQDTKIQLDNIVSEVVRLSSQANKDSIEGLFSYLPSFDNTGGSSKIRLRKVSPDEFLEDIGGYPSPEEVVKKEPTVSELEDLLRKKHPNESDDKIKKRTSEVLRIQGHNATIKGKLKKTKRMKSAIIAGVTLAASLLTAKHSVLLKKVYNKEPLRSKIEISTDGKRNVESKYADFDEYEGKSVLIHNTSWKKTDDNKYTRKTQVYSIENESLFDLDSKIGEIDQVNLGDIYDEVDSFVEKKDTLTQEEMEKGPSTSAIIFEKSKDDYMKVRDKMKEAANKVLFGGITIMWGLLAGLGTSAALKDGSLFESDKFKLEENEDTKLRF